MFANKSSVLEEKERVQIAENLIHLYGTLALLDRYVGAVRKRELSKVQDAVRQEIRRLYDNDYFTIEEARNAFAEFMRSIRRIRFTSSDA